MLLFLSLVSCSNQKTKNGKPTDELELDSVVTRAEEACRALNQFKKDEEAAFDFQTITAMSRLSDALMMTGQHARAEKLLALQLPGPDTKRIVATTAVRFGDPIPSIPKDLDQNQFRIWKLEILISLVHGRRFQEALEYLDNLDEELQKPLGRLRYLKLIAENTVKTGDEKEFRPVANRIWQTIQKLEASEFETRIDYLLLLVEMSQQLKLKSSDKGAFAKIRSEFSKEKESTLNPQFASEFLQRLGNAELHAGEYDQALSRFEHAARRMESVEDEYFDRRMAIALLKLDLAKAHKAKGDSSTALSLTQQSLEAIKDLTHPAEKQSIAKSIDGGQGFFTAVFEAIQYHEYKKAVLAQVEIGEFKTAEKNWRQMPDCIQKIKCQIELAKYFAEQDQSPNASACAQRCLDQITDKTSSRVQFAWRIGALTIYRQNDFKEEGDDLANQLVAFAELENDDILKSSVANELIDLDYLKPGYKIASTISAKRNQALSFSLLAKKLAEKKR